MYEENGCEVVRGEREEKGRKGIPGREIRVLGGFWKMEERTEEGAVGENDVAMREYEYESERQPL